MRGMRPNGRRAIRWAAVAALMVLAFSAVPHLHDEMEEPGDRCVLCHARDTPVIASGLILKISRSAFGPKAAPVYLYASASMCSSAPSAVISVTVPRT